MPALMGEDAHNRAGGKDDGQRVAAVGGKEDIDMGRPEVSLFPAASPYGFFSTAIGTVASILP